MARARDKADMAVPGDYVPRDNDDLLRVYRSFVARLVTRYNRVSSNYEDLHQHVWLKLLESDIISKYLRSGTAPPKKMTADQACVYLGIKWGAFKIAVCRGLYGREQVPMRAPKEIAHQVYERDHGRCCRCGRDTDLLRRALNAMRSDPSKSEAYHRAIQKLREAGISPRHRMYWTTERVTGSRGFGSASDYQTVCCFCYRNRAALATIELRARLLERDHGICSHCGKDYERFKAALDRMQDICPDRYADRAAAIQARGVDPDRPSFWFPEQVGKGNRAEDYCTTCCFCTREIHGVARLKFWSPQPIRGSWASRKAVYSRKDIERFRQLRAEKFVRRGMELPPPPEQEVTRAPFRMYLTTTIHNIYANWCRTRDRRYKETYPGSDTELGRTWEETLVDPIGTRQENQLALYEAIKVISHSKSKANEGDYSMEVEVLAMLAEGVSPADIVQRLGLPRQVLQILAREA